VEGRPLREEERVFSIGHSNLPIEQFVGLLDANGIKTLVDVRSKPYSSYARQFDMAPLRSAVTSAGLRYVFLGGELGGHPDNSEFYDADGHVLYERLAESPSFRQGLEKLGEEAKDRRIAIMCSEEDPASCHRRLLIGRVLAALGVSLEHIRADGRVQTEADLVIEETGGQGDLFADLEDAATWRRSTQSASQRKPRPSSSKR
jgi:uncharacterized protein (DUF488 family)